MFSNFKRAVTLTLLAGAASPVLAAPAPVSDLSAPVTLSSNTSLNNTSSTLNPANETDVQRLERLLQNQNMVNARMQQQVDNLEQELSIVRGELEQKNYDLQQILNRQRDLFVEMDKLRTQLQDLDSAPPVSVVTNEGSQVTDTQTGVSFSSDVDEQAAYTQAVDLILKKKDFSGAISALQKFQTDFPDSVYTPNTHYWLGQLFFAGNEDKKAVEHFASVLAYQDSNKLAESLLKLGDIAKRNNNSTQARKYYQRVIDEHPNSSSAKLAAKQL